MSEMMFTNGAGFKEYAESLYPEEGDYQIVITTVTAIRSLETDLDIVMAERDRLRQILDSVIEDCLEEVKQGPPVHPWSYESGLYDQASTTLEIIEGPTVIEYE